MKAYRYAYRFPRSSPRRSFFLFILFIFLFLPTEGWAATHTLLTAQDVKDVMNQLFEYHIEKKEMTTELIERALKVYVNQFDPSHTYLLQEEVYPFTHPKPEFLKAALQEYNSNRITPFFSLNVMIQQSILRAREWRKSWEKNPKQLIEEAKGVKIEKNKEKSFASNLQDLKTRQKERFLKFIAFQIKEIGASNYEGKESKLISLCEKQFTIQENEFLGVNDQGVAKKAEESDHEVVLRTLKALSHSLDAHTAFYSPDEAYAMKVQLEKGMCGIGVVLREGIEGIIIQDLLKGGPAEKCGNIKAGDTIVEVDGKLIKDFSFQNVLEIMRGKEGSKTILGIMRPKNNKESDFLRVELTRSKIVLEDKRVDVQSEPFGDGFIGKITLHSFYEGENGLSSEQDLKNAITNLKAKGPLYGLVLDMRENSGGFLSQAVRVSGLFISSGVVVISKYSDGTIKYYRAVDGKRFYDGPLVILISRGSASATEIVAQTLRDYGVALVVGDEQTYGKGTIQHQTITNNRAAALFKVTVGRYYTVSGKSTQIDGVKSDILIPSEFNFEDIGEKYLEFPLSADTVPNAFEDTLSDIDPFTQKWFLKYYAPTLQKKEDKWITLIPMLRENSEKRVIQNKNYQGFIKELKKEIKTAKETSFGINDLQMEESVNILKDMIFFSQKNESLKK